MPGFEKANGVGLDIEEGDSTSYGQDKVAVRINLYIPCIYIIIDLKRPADFIKTVKSGVCGNPYVLLQIFSDIEHLVATQGVGIILIMEIMSKGPGFFVKKVKSPGIGPNPDSSSGVFQEGSDRGVEAQALVIVLA